MINEIKEIPIEALQPFKMHSGQTYEGERLQQMMDSIKRLGLMYPMLVRLIENGKYEIICGHYYKCRCILKGRIIILRNCRAEKYRPAALIN